MFILLPRTRHAPPVTLTVPTTIGNTAWQENSEAGTRTRSTRTSVGISQWTAGRPVLFATVAVPLMIRHCQIHLGRVSALANPSGSCLTNARFRRQFLSQERTR